MLKFTAKVKRKISELLEPYLIQIIAISYDIRNDSDISNIAYNDYQIKILNKLKEQMENE